MEISGDVWNLAYSCLIDGCSSHEPITLTEAAYTIQCWQEEGCEAAETAGLTPETFMAAWNSVLIQLSPKERKKKCSTS